MPSKKQQKIREEFLNTFIETLISTLAPKEIPQEIKKEPPKKIQETQEHKIISPFIKTSPSQNYPSPKKTPLIQRTPLPKMPTPSNIKVPPKQTSTTPVPPSQTTFGKITAILRDPSVLSVECPGPNKHILVNRSGVIQTTNITLTKEEIDRVMHEISEKTRIPLITGLFKALYKNLLITAVISDFVGTRFIIQKRTPFMRY